MLYGGFMKSLTVLILFFTFSLIPFASQMVDKKPAKENEKSHDSSPVTARTITE